MVVKKITMDKKILNIAFSLSEYVIGAIVLFLQYRLMIKVLGISSLGLWSLSLTLMSLTSVGTSGFSGSVVRYIAIYKAKSNIKIDRLIETVEITVALISVVLIGILIVLLKYFGLYFFTIAELEVLNRIIPLIVAGFFISTLSGVHLQALDGLQLIYLRNIINIFSKFSYLVLTYILIYNYGIMGISLAFIISAFITILLSIFFIRKYVPTKRIFLLRFDGEVFKELFNYGINFQISSLAQVIYDPLTKILIKRFGGIECVGLYELASKILIQARQLIVVVVNTFVPIVAELKEKNNNEYVKQLYIKIFNFVIIISLALFTLELLVFPIIPEIFLKDKSNSTFSKFNIYYIEIAIGLMINLFSVPAFMFNLGTGNIRSNTNAFVFSAIIYILFEFVIGKVWKDEGVVLGWLIGSIALSCIILIQFQINEKINHLKLFSQSFIYLFIVSTIMLSVFYWHFSNNIIVTYIIIIIYSFFAIKIISKEEVIKSLLSKYNLIY